MTRADLLALAARVEAAAGADRKMDTDVFVAVNPHMRRIPGDSIAVEDGDWIRLSPAFTASLDAAASLVPVGHYWQCANGKRRHSEPQGSAEVFLASGPNRGDMVAAADAATPALALTAAALRAMAEEAGE